MKEEKRDDTEYSVISTEGLSLTFDRRKDARDYKKLLSKSKNLIKSRIIKREYSGGFISSSKEVS